MKTRTGAFTIVLLSLGAPAAWACTNPPCGAPIAAAKVTTSAMICPGRQGAGLEQCLTAYCDGTGKGGSFCRHRKVKKVINNLGELNPDQLAEDVGKVKQVEKPEPAAEQKAAEKPKGKEESSTLSY